MKKTVHFLLIFLSSAILFSCSYDDTDIWSEIDKIKTDLASLNAQVSSIETIVDALNAGKVITKVDQLENGKGHKITFSDGKTIEVLHGEKAPVIGIQESESVYYWTITTDGKTEFLLDAANNKIRVSGKDGEKGEEGKKGEEGEKGEDGNSPDVSIDSEGYWTVNNIRIKDSNGNPVKAQGDSFFKEVIEADDSVTFVLANGDTIVLPKSGGSYLLFEEVDNETVFPFYTPGTQKKLYYKSANIGSLEVIEKPGGWTVDLVEEEKYVEVTASPTPTEGTNKIVLRGLDKNGMVFMAIAKISYKEIDFANPLGIYIVNEGSVWGGEDGSMIYITSDKLALGQVYYNVNGRAPGNCPQDLFIKEGKMYVISQNSKESTDGRLLVANAQTLKKEASYDSELATLLAPTHVAVLNENNIFIRDNRGVSVFNSTTKELTFITGTNGALKNTMAVADNKVFVPASKKILVFEADRKEIAHTITLDAAVSGVLRAEDGNIWVATTGSPHKISKINSADYSLIKANEITVGTVSAGVAAAPGITAKGDTLYHGGLSTKIYRHVFTTGETKLMVDAKEMVENANIVYNTVAVHPITGKVYINTIKGYSQDYKINSITEFDFSGDEPRITGSFKDYTRYPAGVFFNANFN